MVTVHWLYRLALLAYPRAFRARFGRDMQDLFADRVTRDARGRAGRAALALSLIVRTAVAGTTERLRRRPPPRSRMLTSISQDIRHGFRAFRRRPGFTAIILATLALGIGANTAVFSVVYAALLRDLPFPESDRIVRIYETHRPSGFNRGVASPFNYDRWEQRTTTLESMSALRAMSLTLTGAGDPVRLRAQAVMPSFFDVMQTRPAYGRAFMPEEAFTGQKRAILSHGLWRTRFGSDAAAIGRPLTLEGERYEIVGVMPAGFGFPHDTEVWVPLQLTPGDRSNMTSWYLDVVARMRPGVTLETAQAEFDAIAAGLEAEFPQSRSGRGVAIVGLHEALVGSLAGGLKLLQSVVLAVLLIACANVANLLLAQGVTRAHEFGVRTAIGAGRWRLMRQLLTESLMLAMIGAALGALLAVWGVKGLLSLSPESLPEGVSAGVGVWPLVFTAAVAIATSACFGVLPALMAVRTDTAGALRDGGRTGSARRGAFLRRGLVAAEVTLAIVLLAGSGLLIRSFSKLVSQDVGFEPEGVVTALVSLPDGRYPDAPARGRFWTALFERLQVLPGVTSATGSTALPFSNWQWQTIFMIEDHENVRRSAGIRAVTPGYFSTLGVPLVSGRAFTSADTASAEPVLVVNETFARRFLQPIGEPLGQRIATTFRPGGGSTTRGPSITSRFDIEWATVVGVVGDTRHQSLGEPPEAEMYQPIAQQPPGTLTLAIRTTGDPGTLAAAIAPAVADLDKDLPVEAIATLESLVASTVATRRFQMFLLSAFSAIALLLAACGIYGVMAFSVSQRVREMAIRLALGGDPGRVVRLVIRQGLLPVAIGICAGVPLAIAAARLIQSQLFLTSPHDTMTLGAVVGVLTSAALLACWLPARRTAHVEPIEVLRSE